MSWANSTEKTVIQALLKKQPPELCGQPLFSGFESEDAILAALVERGLNPEQEQAVKEALSTSPLLRHQWLSVREARARQPAVGRTWLKPGLALGGVGMVASLALVVVMVWTGKEPEPQLAAKREVRALANVASAPDYAAQPVPLSAWTAFLTVYAGEQSPAISSSSSMRVRDSFRALDGQLNPKTSALSAELRARSPCLATDCDRRVPIVAPVQGMADILTH